MKKCIYLSLLLLPFGGWAQDSEIDLNSGGASHIELKAEQLELGFPDRLRIGYDVHYYDLDICFQNYSSKIAGSVSIHTTTNQNMDSARFDLAKNLNLDSLFVNGKKVNTPLNRRYMAVRFALPENIGANQKMILQIWYHGKVKLAKKPPWQGGFVKKRDKWGNPWMGIACESEGANTWFPCKDQEADEADSVKLTYHVPNQLMAVGNGSLVSESGWTPNKKTKGKTYTWKVSYPINTYNITFYIGDFVATKGDIPLQGGEVEYCHYVLRNDSLRAAKHFQHAVGIVHFFDSIYGEYPWRNDGFKLIESPYEGMEHQTAIAIGNDLRNSLSKFNYPGLAGKLIMNMFVNILHMDTASMRRYDYLVLHESAHEWWGNSVTANDFAHVWLQEGMATFSELLYIEDRFGPEAAWGQKNFQAFALLNNYPVVGKMKYRDFNYKHSDVYYKGSLAMQALRDHLDNDSLFFTYIKALYSQFKVSTTDTKSFVDFTNEFLGKDYTKFFHQLFYTYKQPSIEYFWSDDEKTLNYRLDEAVNFGMDIRVKIHLKSGKDLLLTPTSEFQGIPIERSDVYSSIEFGIFKWVQISKN